MKVWQENAPEIDEVTDEYMEEEPEKGIVEEENQEKVNAKDVWWMRDIGKIENDEIREKEIEAAEKIEEEERELDEKLESGEIDEIYYWARTHLDLHHEKSRLATRCALEAEGITYDHIGDKMEDLDLTITEARGNPKPARMKDELKESIRRIGPEASQELADQKKEEDDISKDTHESISRQVRLAKK